MSARIRCHPLGSSLRGPIPLPNGGGSLAAILDTSLISAWAGERSITPSTAARRLSSTPSTATSSPTERIVYSSVLSQDGRPATVSTTTVELETCDEGTRLVLTEQGAYLDGLEQPDWREQGTGEWLDRLGAELRNAIEGGH